MTRKTRGPKDTPCVICGRKFTTGGLSNHINHCRNKQKEKNAMVNSTELSAENQREQGIEEFVSDIRVTEKENQEAPPPVKKPKKYSVSYKNIPGFISFSDVDRSKKKGATWLIILFL